jgi:hypothetical protein
MAAFINTYSAIEDGCLATNIFIKEHAKRDIIIVHLLQPDFSQLVTNFTTFTS